MSQIKSQQMSRPSYLIHGDHIPRRRTWSTMVNTSSYGSNKIMTNADNTYGTFNKKTQILTQIDDVSTALQNFADVDTAKSWFYTANALTVFDECCTELQWSVVDSQKLK